VAQLHERYVIIIIIIIIIITHVNYQKVIKEGDTGNQALFGQKKFREFT